MLPTKSGATINLETPNMTFAVRKDVIEIVYKVKPGIFLIVNVTRVDAERGMLFVNWGNYFRRLSNEKAQMPKLLKHCPTLYEILVGEDKDGVMVAGAGPQYASLHHREIPARRKECHFERCLGLKRLGYSSSSHPS